MAATAAGYSFFAMMFPQKLHNLASQFSNSIWAPDSGLPSWAFFGLAIVLLGTLLLPGWLRRGSTLRVAVAVTILVFASGIAGRVKPAAPLSIAATAQEIDLSAIRPVIRSAEVQFHEGGLDNEAFTRASVAGAGVTASIVAEGCPPGYNVQWQVLPQSELRKSGRTIGKKQPPVPGHEPEAGFSPRGNHPGEKAAIQAVLPRRGTPLAPLTGYRYDNDDPTSLGRFSIERGIATPDLAEVSLDLSLSGFVYRYDRVLDAPLDETVATARHGDITYRVRRCATTRGEPAAELAISMPLSFTQSARAAVQLFGRANPPLECFLHLPESGVNLPLKTMAYSGTPLLSGAVIQRFVFGWEGDSFERLKLNGHSARVIVLKPVVVAKIERALASAPVRLADEKQRWSDYAITRNYSMDDSLYLSRHLPFRPDPLTCTREEFGRWLRIPALIHGPRSLLPRDIADYAPRFNELLAKAASNDNVAAAIALGTPESRRGAEISAIATIYNPNYLISVINERGWRDEAAGQIKARFARGDINRDAIEVVMALEDPATYPILINGLIQAPSLERYDVLRRLPGIQGNLYAAITKAFAEANYGEVLAKANGWQESFPYGPYLLPARQGDPRALELMFDIARNSKSYSKVPPMRQLIAAPQEAVSSDEQWVRYLETRSAKDFRYDPLSQMWIPLPR